MSRLFDHFVLEARRVENQLYETLGVVHGELVVSPDVPRSSGLTFTADPPVLEYFDGWASSEFSIRQVRIVQEDSGLMWSGSFLVSVFGKTVQLQSTGDLVEEGPQPARQGSF